MTALLAVLLAAQEASAENGAKNDWGYDKIEQNNPSHSRSNSF